MKPESGASTSVLRVDQLPTPPAGRPEVLRTFSALGSGVRSRILASISGTEKSIPELAEELRLNRVTLRYHITYLLGQGLIEKVEVVGPRKAGRPPAMYRASRHAFIQGFPERHYDLLGQFALEAFVDAVGLDTATEYLERKGADVGRSMIDGVRARAKIGAWNPDLFDRLVLSGLYREFGIPSEVLSKTSNALDYRSFGCPFLELAERMPELVCNSLDAGFHRGVDEALGGVKTERLACMGHGDPYCAYRVTWKGPAAAKGLRSRARKPKVRTERGKHG